MILLITSQKVMTAKTEEEKAEELKIYWEITKDNWSEYEE